jgi:hypothetical protein
MEKVVDGRALGPVSGDQSSILWSSELNVNFQRLLIADF